MSGRSGRGRWFVALAVCLAGACGAATARHEPAGDGGEGVDPEDAMTMDPRPGRDAARPDATADESIPDAAPSSPDLAPVAADAAPGADRAVAEAGEPPSAPGACPDLTAGWTAYQPITTIQFEGGGSDGITEQPTGDTRMDAHCTYTNKDGIELFRMTKNPAGVRQRCEARVHNDYQTGSNQFEGEVRVTAGDGTCVHQVFKFLMLVAYPQNGGELHQHSQTFLASGVFGKWVHVNTVHDVASGKVDIYLDCVKKLTIPQSAPSAAGGWYNKYGVYNLGGAVAQSEWKNVRYFRR